MSRTRVPLYLVISASLLAVSCFIFAQDVPRPPHLSKPSLMLMLPKRTRSAHRLISSGRQQWPTRRTTTPAM